MKTSSAGLTCSILQRIFVALVITAAFLSAAFAAILPTTEFSHSASVTAPPTFYPENLDSVNLKFAGITPAPELLVLNLANETSRDQRPKAFSTVGTEYFAQSINREVNVGQWAELVDPNQTENNTMTHWSLPNISYPNIQSTAAKLPLRFKEMITYRSLATADSESLVPIPAVRCMGLSSVAVARRADRYEQSIQKLSIQYGISANLVKAVITKESCFDPKARSYVGAIGLMQLMPETAEWLKVENPHDPQQNLQGGIKYLASLYKRFERVDLTLAAYNAGPGNVERHGGIPPFNETQNYVKSVLSNYRYYTATAKLKGQLALN